MFCGILFSLKVKEIQGIRNNVPDAVRTFADREYGRANLGKSGLLK
jgi:hypothetical protein